MDATEFHIPAIPNSWKTVQINLYPENFQVPTKVFSISPTCLPLEQNNGALPYKRESDTFKKHI